MLDEVGGVPSNIASSFWNGLRGIFTKGGVLRQVIFLLAGELDMRQLVVGANSPLANVCINPFIDLRDCTKDQVRTLVHAGLPKDERLVDEIEEWTAGHPYLTQKLCALWKRKFVGTRTLLKHRLPRCW